MRYTIYISTCITIWCDRNLWSERVKQNATTKSERKDSSARNLDNATGGLLKKRSSLEILDCPRRHGLDVAPHEVVSTLTFNRNVRIGFKRPHTHLRSLDTSKWARSVCWSGRLWGSWHALSQRRVCIYGAISQMRYAFLRLSNAGPQ